MIVLKNQFKIQMLHSDWSNSNFWINTLYFMCMLAMLKKILMILWSSQIQKMFLHISILSWSRAHLKMGLFSFPCVKISSLILSFSFNYPLFLQKYYNFSKRKIETIVIWRKNADSKADEIDWAKTDYLQLFMISSVCQHKKKSKGKWKFSKYSDKLALFNSFRGTYFFFWLPNSEVVFFFAWPWIR